MSRILKWTVGFCATLFVIALILAAGFTAHKIRRNRINKAGHLKSFTSTESHNTDMKVLDGTSGSNIDISSQGRRASVPKPVFHRKITDADVENYVPPQSTNLGHAKAGNTQLFTDSENTFKVFQRDSGTYEEVV